jgi:uncharacterized Zn finger protein (UPF0148 family)
VYFFGEVGSYASNFTYIDISFIVNGKLSSSITMKSNDDELVKKMADLLVREKATMLDKVCPECGTLLYKLPTGKIICPSCNREVKIVKNNMTSETDKPESINQHSNTFTILLHTIYDKIGVLNEKLTNEIDISQIERIAKSIEILFKIYERVYQFHLDYVEK